MNTYIWVGIIIGVILFSVWRMEIEYRRGYRDGATKILDEWREFVKVREGGDIDG
jgi:hypothetical protein